MDNSQVILAVVVIVFGYFCYVAITKQDERERHDIEPFDNNTGEVLQARSKLLTQIVNGTVTMHENGDLDLPFILPKGEYWVYCEPVHYYETKTVRHYGGRSDGVSIRVARGLWYRTGGNRGQSQSVDELQYIGNGIVHLTNKSIRYHSAEKQWRIPYDKLLTITTQDDLLVFAKDSANPKPQAFLIGDDPILYEIIKALASAKYGTPVRVDNNEDEDNA